MNQPNQIPNPQQGNIQVPIYSQQMNSFSPLGPNQNIGQNNINYSQIMNYNNSQIINQFQSQISNSQISNSHNMVKSIFATI